MTAIAPRFDIDPEFLAEQGLSPTFPRRFWSRVFITPTHWLWEGPFIRTGGHGYLGRGFKVNGKCKNILAHRASWIIHRGPIPDGADVLHCCPGRHIAWCINPDHLYLGDQAQNNRDMIGQGTHYVFPPHFGEENPNVKLTWEKVRDIRQKYTTGKWTQAALADEHDVTRECIMMITTHRSWKE